MSLTVSREADGVVVRLVLDRPEKRNALNGALVLALREALAAVRDEVEDRGGEGRGATVPRVVVLSGAGSDFCSGADLSELEKIAEMGPEASLQDASRMGELFLDMRRHPLPILAAVHGRALAGGCGLAAACDLIVAHRDAEFGFPEVHLGFVPAMVMTMLRRKVVEGRAFELVSRGERIPAAEAYRIGLVNRVFEGEEFQARVADYASELARPPGSALLLTKRLLYGLDGTGFDEGIRRGAEVNSLARLTDECRDGVRRFLERAHRAGD